MMLHRKQYICYAWYHGKSIASLKNRHIHQSCILYLRKPSSARKTTNYLPETSNITDSSLFQNQKAVSYGNANFYGIEGDEGVIYADDTLHSQQLIKDSMKNLQPEPKSEFKYTSFGAVRLDSENKPTHYARVGRLKLSLNSEKVDSESSEYTFKPNTEIVSNKTVEGENMTDNINYISATEQNLSHFLSGRTEELKPTTKPSNLSEPIKNSSETKLKSAHTLEKDQADLYYTQKSNFIDDIYFPTVKDTESNVNNEETKKIISSKIDNHKTESVNQQVNIQSVVKTSNYIDGQYFPDATATDLEEINKNNFSSKNDIHKTLLEVKQQDNISTAAKTSNYIDEQYFPDVTATDSPEKSSQKEYNFIDEQYFSDVDSNNTTIKNNPINYDLNAISNDLNLNYGDNITSPFDVSDFTQQNDIQTNEKLTFSNLQLQRDTDVENISDMVKYKSKHSVFVDTNTNKNYSSNSEKRNKSARSADHVSKISTSGTETDSSISTSKVQTETAYDFVKQLRKKEPMSDEVKRGIPAKKEKKVDSKGFRILKHQVPSLMYFTRDEMLELLKENILFIDEDIVILNKPYNLIIHESNSTKNNACLSMYLNDFAQIIGERDKSPELFTVHRLDKETTGCLLLARNQESAQRMKSLFAQRKIIKTYWIVTSKVPDPREGVIDIPISEGRIKDKARMVLHPDIPNDIAYRNHSKCGKRAVTYYTVIATSGNAALVEVKPETGIKHQIRVHFGFGLSCPILGDHKYSYLDKLVPQKLSSDLLQRLHVRQSKVRHVPLHIHSKHILIPQYADQKNLFVTAPLPHHISENLRFLKFKKK